MAQRSSAKWFILAALLLVVVLFVLPSVMFVVDQREMVVVLQFGNPVAEYREPGLHFKLPLIQEITRLPSTKQFWGDEPGLELPDLPTIDDKKIEVIPWAVWRITEPTPFVQRLRSVDNAEQRVSEFVRGAIRDVITKHNLAELVRSTKRQISVTTLDEGLPIELQITERPAVEEITLGRLKVLEAIKLEAQRRLNADRAGLGSGRGIELIDLGISQIQFVPSVQSKTFDRWISERMAIAARYTSDGQRRKQEILNRTAAEVQKIEGEGQERANTLKGEVDARIITQYADAMQQAGEFFSFVRTLQAYRSSFRSDTRIILTTDSEFFQLLKKLPPPEAAGQSIQAAAPSATAPAGTAAQSPENGEPAEEPDSTTASAAPGE